MKVIREQLHGLKTLLQGKGLKAKLIKDSAWSLIISIFNKAFTLIMGILLIRIIGKSQYGIYSYVLSLVLILIIPIEYGIANLIVRETAQAESYANAKKISGVWRWSFSLTVSISLFITIIGLAVSVIWGFDLYSQNEILTFIWGLSLLLFQALVHIINAALRGMKKLVLGQLPDLIFIPGFFILLFTIFSLATPYTLTSSYTMALRSLSTFLAFLISLYFLISKTPPLILKAKPVYEGKKWFNSFLPLGLSSGLNMVKNHTSILIMGIFVTAGDIGSYQISISTAALAAMVLHILNTILAPQFASLFSLGEKRKMQRLVTISSRVVFAFNVFVSIIFLLWGRFILSFVFGPETVDAYPPLLILLLGQLVNASVGSVAFLLNMTGYEKDVMKVVGISTILNIIITLFFTPIWGIVGAALAATASLIFAQITMHLIVKKRLGINSSVLGKQVNVF